MPSNYTPNYRLSQWEADDRVVRTDFNADNLAIDTALGALAEQAKRLERAAERANYNAYNLILQRAYAGEYTGWRKDLIFDGFQDDSKIASMTEGLLLSTGRPGLFLNSDTQNADVNYGYRFDNTLAAGQSASSEWVCNRAGTITQITLYMSGEASLKLEALSSGKSWQNTAKSQTYTVVEVSMNLPADPGETYRLTVTAKTAVKMSSNTGSVPFGFKMAITPRLPQASSGTMISKPYSLDRDVQHVQVWLRRRVTIMQDISVRFDSTGDWILQKARRSYDGNNFWGEECISDVFQLQAVPAGSKTIEIKLDFKWLSPLPNTVIYDYRVDQF